MDSVRSQTEHLSLVELLGGVRSFDRLPLGWVTATALDNVPSGTKVYIKNLRSREWEQGTVIEYWEKGQFLEVRCNGQIKKVFVIENLGISVK